MSDVYAENHQKDPQTWDCMGDCGSEVSKPMSYCHDCQQELGITATGDDAPLPERTEIIMIPCPFCAGPPVLIYKYLHDGEWSNAIPVPFESDDGHYLKAWVFCHECGCDGPTVDDICCDLDEFEDLKKRALNNWNNRDERHRNLYDVNLADGRGRYPRTDLTASDAGVTRG